MNNYKEIEAKFYYIDKGEIRKKLQEVKAQLVHAETKMIRAIFEPIAGKSSINGNYARVRQEYDKITMSIKSQVSHGGSMEDNKEIELEVNDFETAVDFLRGLNLSQKAYQETLRETWRIDDALITIDTWPWLEPYIEIESKSEEDVLAKAKLLDVVSLKTTVDAVTYLFTEKYDVSAHIVNTFPHVTFEAECPWNIRKYGN